MPNSFLRTILENTRSFIKYRLLSFLKGSFLIPVIFSTLLYILMRVFFIGVEFTATESIELYVKTFLITWTHVNAWRLICMAIVWVDIKTTKVPFTKVVSMPVFKRTAILVLIAGLTYSVKAGSIEKPAAANEGTVLECEDIMMEADPGLYRWMK